jgi:chromosome segregation ATPase
VDALELQLASALQRLHTLERRAETQADNRGLLTRSLAELSTALEEVRVAQEQIIENRRRLEDLQAELSAQAAKYWQLFDEIPSSSKSTAPPPSFSMSASDSSRARHSASSSAKIAAGSSTRAGGSRPNAAPPT